VPAGGGEAFCEEYGCGFGDVHLEFPLTEISM
jgi:hypothetical protein